MQARWRGAQQRRRAGRPAAAAAERLRQALRRPVAEPQTLGARAAAALHTLQQSYHISQVFHEQFLEEHQAAFQQQLSCLRQHATGNQEYYGDCQAQQFDFALGWSLRHFPLRVS